MCCCDPVTGIFPSDQAPEFQKRYKPENNGGCCRGGHGSCDEPSKALKNSAVWKWEQKYGQIKNQITEEIGADGRRCLVHVKTVCPVAEKKVTSGCCTLKYRIGK